MTQLEKYKEISKWVDIFHKRSKHHTGILPDCKHDIWLKVANRDNINLAYIQETCKHYPLYALLNVYYKRTSRVDGVRREVVLLDEDGAYVDFPDFGVEYEFPVAEKPKSRGRTLTPTEIETIKNRIFTGQFTTKAALAREFKITYNMLCDIQSGRSYKKLRRLKVHYRNGQTKTFDTTQELSEELGVTIKTLRHRIGKPLVGRYTERKLSHVTLIEWSTSEALSTAVRQ
jgi:hypothetical protein